MPLVSNSSPLIALEQIEKLDLLHELFGFGNNRSGTLLPDTLRPALGPGERAAISLAAEVKASTIILDEEPARKVAVQLKIPIIGTAGVLVLAKDLKLIVAVKPCLDALIEQSVFPGSRRV